MCAYVRVRVRVCGEAYPNIPAKVHIVHKIANIVRKRLIKS